MFETSHFLAFFSGSGSWHVGFWKFDNLGVAKFFKASEAIPKEFHGTKARVGVDILSYEGSKESIDHDAIRDRSSFNNVIGSSLNDFLRGGNSGGILHGDGGNDSIFGGTGDDALYGGLGRDFIVAGAGNDLLSGGDGSDSLSGDAGNDILFGGAGLDILAGGDGDDSLNGEAGNDRLFGDAGADTLKGGSGEDQFTFYDVGDSSVTKFDTILDFSRAERDFIELSGIDANTTLEGDQEFSFIGKADFSAAGQLRLVDSTNLGFSFFQGDVDGDGTADFVVRINKIDGGLIATDFRL
jgi:Ca2+-binding RTX toxin-like protein